MTIRSFDLLQPRSLHEAVELLHKHGDESRVIAGGTTLVILMKQRALHYRYLVDLQSIPGLAGINNETDGVRIGALASHRMVETVAVDSPVIPRTGPSLRSHRQRAGASDGIGGRQSCACRLPPRSTAGVAGAQRSRSTSSAPKAPERFP